MTKHRITMYVDTAMFERIQKNQRLREKVFPPGWPKIGSYSVHLMEEGLKTEELSLEERQKELQLKDKTRKPVKEA